VRRPVECCGCGKLSNKKWAQSIGYIIYKLYIQYIHVYPSSHIFYSSNISQYHYKILLIGVTSGTENTSRSSSFGKMFLLASGEVHLEKTRTVNTKIKISSVYSDYIVIVTKLYNFFDYIVTITTILPTNFIVLIWFYAPCISMLHWMKIIIDRYRQCIELGQESLPGPNRFQSLLRAQRYLGMWWTNGSCFNWRFHESWGNPQIICHGWAWLSIETTMVYHGDSGILHFKNPSMTMRRWRSQFVRRPRFWTPHWGSDQVSKSQQSGIVGW
jgi:hypothetical protein